MGVFFTLSGYLITDILLGQWASAGRIRLGDFWLRRARRLLPALFVLLAAVAVWVNVFDRARLPGFRGDVVASALYANNWWYITQHASYYAQFAPPAPLDHLWSLAVEEQFYLVWPWLVLLGVWLLGRRRRPGRMGAAARWQLTGWTLALAAVSAVLMASLYRRWVLALGVNDTADVFAGSGVGRTQRIKRMMSVIGDQPVLWVQVKSLVPNGPYAERNMRLWNQALARERSRYPNMRVYDWPAVVRGGWFIRDGIHYTSYGYAQRARLIAAWLAQAFPA